MSILAITQHAPLLERLRSAFGPTGHEVRPCASALEVLTQAAWAQAQAVLVDAEGDPMDGYQFCHLLRAESRMLCQNVPVYLILDHPPGAEDQVRLRDAEGNGFLDVGDSPRRLFELISRHPAPEAPGQRRADQPSMVLAAGLDQTTRQRLTESLGHLGFSLEACAWSELPGALAAHLPVLLLLGAGGGATEARACLDSLPSLTKAPYPVLVGHPGEETVLADRLASGSLDWLALPVSEPLLALVVRRALERRHDRRVLQECRRQIDGLVTHRDHLEAEAALLRNEVLMDPLTELLNRRAFTQHLDHATNQWVRHLRPFVLILGDLDYFKLINDRFGHLVGDQVLKAVSQRIRATLRRSDLAFRIGGEEFAILLTETHLSAGLDVADKIRRRIDEAPVTLETGQSVFPTMSFGIGGPEGAEPEELFARVDQALYSAKHKGRNRVEVAEKSKA